MTDDYMTSDVWSLVTSRTCATTTAGCSSCSHGRAARRIKRAPWHGQAINMMHLSQLSESAGSCAESRVVSYCIGEWRR